MEEKITYNWPTEREILQKFKKINILHHCFDDNDGISIKQFILLFQLLKFQNDFVTDNHLSERVIMNNAYKLTLLFDPNLSGDNWDQANMLRNIDKKLKEMNLNTAKFVRSLTIPTMTKPIDLSGWRNLFKSEEENIKSILPFAEEIEKSFEEDEKKERRAPNTLKEAYQRKALATYRQANSDIEFAGVCIEYKVDESRFNKCLTFINHNQDAKREDSLPDIEISSENYKLVKMPKNDKRALILGFITNCCQSIGGESDACVRDGWKLSDNGFYVLLKARTTKSKNSPAKTKDGINYDEYQIIGQGYAWRSKLNNIVFDSWENLNKKNDKKIVEMLEIFSDRVIKSNDPAFAVLIGQGGKTPEHYKKDPINYYTEEMLQGTNYDDSIKQTLISNNFSFEKMKHLFPSDDSLPIKQIEKNIESYINWISTSEDNLFANFIGELDKKSKLSDSISKIIIQGAAKNGLQTTLKFMLEKGLSPDTSNQIKNSLLMLAAKNGHVKCMEMLVEHKANIDVRNAYNETALSFAAKAGKMDCLKYLIEHKCNIETKDNTDKTPLMYAAENNQLECMQELINQGVAIEDKDASNTTALMFAVEKDHVECLKELIKRGATIAAKNRINDTVPMIAIRNGSKKCLDALLTHINDQQTLNDLLIFAAKSEKDRSECLELLIRKGADINSKIEHSRETALMLAVRNGNAECLKLLIKEGANINANNKSSESPSMIAIANKKLEALKILIESEAEIESRNLLGMSLLMLSVSQNNIEMTNYLLNQGAKVNARDASQYTALMHAAEEDNIELVKILLNAGANPTCKSVDDETALDLARDDSVIALLEEATLKHSVKQKTPSASQPVSLIGMFANSNATNDSDLDDSDVDNDVVIAPNLF